MTERGGQGEHRWQRRARGGRDPVRPDGPTEEFLLTSEGAAAFVRGVTDPPEPNENLRALAEKAEELPGQARYARESAHPHNEGRFREPEAPEE